jgi:hypothetical protein
VTPVRDPVPSTLPATRGYPGPPVSQLSLAERLRRRFRRSLLAPLDARLAGVVRRQLNARREFRPVFVTGAMGSGTTLLAFSLGQTFDFACVIGESAHQVAKRSFLHSPGVEAFPDVRSYEEAIRPRPGWSVEQAREDLLRLYRSHARGPSDRALDKGPNTNLLRGGFLARCFPDGRFVVVFRDPVANVEGFRRKWRTFGADSLDESIRFYASIHESFLAEAAGFADRVVFVEYEALVRDYDPRLGALARRLALDPARNRRRLASRANVPGQGIRNVAGGRIGVVRDANEHAYGNLSEPEIARIRETLAPLHARMRARALAG